jgi:hypothetical protein
VSASDDVAAVIGEHRSDRQAAFAQSDSRFRDGFAK